MPIFTQRGERRNRLLSMASHFLRPVWRNPRFVVFTVALLSVGIGAVITVATLADAVYFRRLPVPKSERLVGIHGTREGELCGNCISYPDYLLYRERAKTLSGIAVYGWTWLFHSDGGNSKELLTGTVTPNFFEILRVQPLIGRFFTEEENRAPNAHPVVVLSEAVWRERFRADPAILGETLRLNRIAMTVIGVAPKSVERIYTERRNDLWIPYMMTPMGSADTKFIARQQYGGMDLIARLADGVSREQAVAELAPMAAASAAAFPDTNKDEGLVVVPLSGIFPRDRELPQRAALYLGTVSAALLLLICGNVAGLLLSRAMARRKEFAIRRALGASRIDVVRQLTAESSALAVMAAGGGLLCAAWMQQVLISQPNTWFAQLDLRLTPEAAGEALLACFAIAFLFGGLPALAASRTASLRGRGQTRSSPLRTILIGGQVALAVMLLSSTALVIESVRSFVQQAGPSADQIAAFRMRPLRIGYDRQRAEQYQRSVVRKLEAMPGVEAAVLARFGPSRNWCCAVDVRIPENPRLTLREVANNDVSPRFFQTLGIPLLAGREFEERDGRGGTAVAIVNESLARRSWPGSDPIGRRLQVDQVTYVVVGLVKDTQPAKSGEAGVPYLYRAYWQWTDGDSRLLIHTRGNARPMMAQLRTEIASVNADVHFGQEQNLRELVEMTYSNEKLLSVLLPFAALMALVLSCAGLYAALNLTVGQRRGEIAIRMAIGAAPGAIGRMVLSEGLRITAIGTAVGLSGGIAIGRVIESQMYGVNAGDWHVYAAVCLILGVTGVAACAAPAWYASSMNPVEALKAE